MSVGDVEDLSIITHLGLSEVEITTAAVAPYSETFVVHSGNQGERGRIGESIPA